MASADVLTAGQRPRGWLRKDFLVRSLAVLGFTVLVTAAGLGSSGLRQSFSRFQAGHAHLPRLDLIAAASLPVRIHLCTVAAAFAVSTVLLTGKKGTVRHRALGWLFAVLMVTTAVGALFIHGPLSGHVSPLHLFSLYTLITLPRAILAARRGDAARHGRMMASLYFGGLVFAGLVALYPGHLMWNVFFG